MDIHEEASKTGRGYRKSGQETRTQTAGRRDLQWRPERQHDKQTSETGKGTVKGNDTNATTLEQTGGLLAIGPPYAGHHSDAGEDLRIQPREHVADTTRGELVKGQVGA